MFLSRRATQAEYTDSPNLPFEEVAANYRQLARVNRVLAFADLYTRHLARWLGAARCRRLRILDVGAGDGSLGQTMVRWSRAQGWDWDVTNLDRSEFALQLHPGGRNVRGSVTALPFADCSFDLVIASQMTHHLTRGDDVIRHFREAWRVSRDAVCISDLHRNAGSYGCLMILLYLLRLTPSMRQDGLLSIKRGWRMAEWNTLVEQAELPDAKVWLYFGAKVVLQARKDTAPQKEKLEPAVHAERRMG